MTMMDMNSDNRDISVERHPFPPYIPLHARVLIMGTFPPPPLRWAMEFYYPNRSNDFWKMMGLIFANNPDRFYDPSTRSFRLDDIRRLLDERGIALSDTGAAVKRLRGNASDKFLEIVEPVDLPHLLQLMPECHTIATTGEKAATVVAELTDSSVPAIGEHIRVEDYCGRALEIWRMPSTSRAYPLSLEKKSLPYERLFRSVGLLC